MNIFVVDLDPESSAIQLCDKHVWKMHTESVQLLVSLSNNLGIQHDVQTKDGGKHKGGYPHHPCCKWLEESIENVEWLLRHSFALCFEHQHRQKIKGRDFIPYSYRQLNDWVGSSLPCVERMLPKKPLTPFKQCMPDKYQCDDAVRAYQSYYIGDKANIARWNYRPAPEWWTESVYLSQV